MVRIPDKGMRTFSVPDKKTGQESRNLCRASGIRAKKWSQLMDSNLRPTVYKTVALPLS